MRLGPYPGYNHEPRTSRMVVQHPPLSQMPAWRLKQALGDLIQTPPQPESINEMLDRVARVAREMQEKFLADYAATDVRLTEQLMYHTTQEEDMPNPNRFGDATMRAEVQKIRERLTEQAAEARMKVKLELAEALAGRLTARLEEAEFEDVIVSFDKVAGSRTFHYVGVFIDEAGVEDGRWFLSGAESGSMSTPDLVAFLLGGTPIRELFFLRRSEGDYWRVDQRPATELAAGLNDDKEHSEAGTAVKG